MAGAGAVRRSKVEREFAEHAREIAAAVAAQFQPVYERVCRDRDAAVERAAILQTAVELIGTAEARAPLTDGVPDWQSLVALAQRTLDQLGIVPDVQTEETASGG